jgi:hypothetical protein
MVFSFGPMREQQMKSASEVEQVTSYLKDILTPDDVVVVSDAADACYWYYFVNSGIPDSAIRAIKSRPFYGAYVVVYPNFKDENFDKVLKEHGPDYIFFDMKTKKIITQIGSAVIYRVEPFPDVIRKVYNLE